MSEKKETYYTEAQARAAKKYLTEKVDEFKVRVPKGKKEIYKNHAEKMGESLNKFIERAAAETMERDISKTE